MNIKCRLFGHKWKFGKDEIICDRCPATLARNTPMVSVPTPYHVDYRKYTVVPIETLQVAEAACREAKYYKTAKELRKCLTAEK